MSPRVSIAAISSFAFLALLLLGFWVGAFETFGGFVSRQRVFLWISLAIGLLTAWLLVRRWRLRYVLAVTFFVLSHFIYVLGQAFGQTYYVGVKDAEDLVCTLWMALNGQL